MSDRKSGWYGPIRYNELEQFVPIKRTCQRRNHKLNMSLCQPKNMFVSRHHAKKLRASWSEITYWPTKVCYSWMSLFAWNLIQFIISNSLNTRRYTSDRHSVITLLWRLLPCNILWTITAVGQQWTHSVTICTCCETRAFLVLSCLLWPNTFHISLNNGLVRQPETLLFGLALRELLQAMSLLDSHPLLRMNNPFSRSPRLFVCQYIDS